ncbi:3-oxoacyl-[acyl-carrier protein] reductase [Desulfobotulus alkaliphilus]|uniref:3-oxoacyl-[acyl-carrier protein] reductase n=1 Tax=Desulfobotulus alkaliphilus TaxID=622671 RepID=A0A562RC82_9BACT|nr:SDR family oxidoreductase [Desulfobotulus alkaliphilus]TWI66030.1 3-oxoacyl-[acyl-carrier protein] reductase [Desulfobotulus alkaliphilus]
MKLKGKVALVPGSVRGIGKAIALDLAAEGASLALTRFDWPENFHEMEADFTRTGTPFRIFDIDLRNTGAIADLMGKIHAHFGRLDILINNIERGGMPVVHGKYTEAQWDLEQETTLRAKQWLAEAALPLLKASGEGCLINISSIAALTGRSGPAGLLFNEGYAAANRGISILTETWARLGAPEVRVNELMLGLMETRHGPRTRGWGLMSSEQQKALTDHTLLGRIGLPEDVVRAVRFLVLDAPFMTGSVLRLDGGYVLGGDRVPPMPVGVE